MRRHNFIKDIVNNVENAMKKAVDMLNQSKQGTKYEFIKTNHVSWNGVKDVGGCGVVIKK